MEKDRTTEFDKKIHKQKIGWYQNRLRENGEWEYEVTDCEKYIFTLKNGDALDITRFEFVTQDSGRDLNNFLLAEVNGEVVGFLWVGISLSKNKAGYAVADSDVEVLFKGIGVGSRLESVKQVILQRRANETGPIENEITDQNAWLITEELDKAKKQCRTVDDRRYREKVEELLMVRQNWLVIYGLGGKGGYINEDKSGLWSKQRVIYKRYLPGESVPNLDCEVKKISVGLKELMR